MGEDVNLVLKCETERKRPRNLRDLSFYNSEGIQMSRDDIEEEVVYDGESGESDDRLDGSYWRMTVPGKRVRKNGHLDIYDL